MLLHEFPAVGQVFFSRPREVTMVMESSGIDGAEVSELTGRDHDGHAGTQSAESLGSLLVGVAWQGRCRVGPAVGHCLNRDRRSAITTAIGFFSQALHLLPLGSST
jgi:hypothetical protein